MKLFFFDKEISFMLPFLFFFKLALYSVLIYDVKSYFNPRFSKTQAIFNSSVKPKSVKCEIQKKKNIWCNRIDSQIDR